VRGEMRLVRGDHFLTKMLTHLTKSQKIITLTERTIAPLIGSIIMRFLVLVSPCLCVSVALLTQFFPCIQGKPAVYNKICFVAQHEKWAVAHFFF